VLRRSQSFGGRAAGAALALAMLGCRPASSSAPLDAGVQAQTRAASPPPVGLILPAGWVVNTGADGVVRASSPRGQPVLRADVQRGVGLPTPETLRTGFLGGLRHLRSRSDRLTEAPGFIAMRFVLGEPDGGPPETEALLSATSLGEDTLLCASLRGATHEELDALQAACQAARNAPGRP
jgi:hypothetical protein